MVAPAIEVTDWLAIKARVDTLVTDPVMQVFEPGAIIPASFSAEPILMLGDVTNDTDRIGIDASLHVRSGSLMLTARLPIALPDWDHARQRQLAGQIAAHFPADACMTFGASRLRVREDATARQPYSDGAYRYLPVVARWWNR